MRKLAAFLTVAVSLAVWHAPAHAAFHLWTVNEIYSSASGALQYVELHDNSDFENFIAGHNVIASGGGPDRTFMFTANLPTTSTANKTLLLATANFQATTGVTPDYTLPAGFLSLGGGSVLFDGSFSSIAYAAGAFNGNKARGPGNVAQTPSPKNFAGQTATIVPEPGSALAVAAWAALAASGRRRRRRPIAA